MSKPCSSNHSSSGPSQDAKENKLSSSTLPSAGLVENIRKRWTVHEDEALALRLQNEEISHHYDGNRIRNAIIREDVPRAKEAQQKEEQDALIKRMEHLSLLQRQAEEDAKFARLISAEESSNESSSVAKTCDSTSRAESKILPCVLTEVGPSSSGCSGSPFPIAAHEDMLLCSSASGYTEPSKVVEDIDMEIALVRQKQEEQDAELAKLLQEELERLEADKKIAIEAQDREYAKMLYDKEKARLRRAKERARLKAAEAQEKQESISSDPDSIQSGREPVPETSTSPVCSINQRHSPLHLEGSPPRIPDKNKKHSVPTIEFRACPKRLPPLPVDILSGIDNRPNSSSSDPVPPYMPMKGFKGKKKS